MDELKTHLRGSQIVLRSKTPDLVRQEFYGLMMTHFAVRGLMHEAALMAEEDPDRLSFLHAVRVVRRKLAHFAAIPPQERKAFHNAVLAEILEERVSSNSAGSKTQDQSLSCSCSRCLRHRPDRVCQVRQNT
jgi:hypothetical protein